MKTIFTTIIAGFISFTAFSQVGIGTTNPNSSALVEIASATKGFLLPRVTFSQRNSITPTTGLQLYCTDCGSGPGELQIYNGTLWSNASGSAASGLVFNPPINVVAIPGNTQALISFNSPTLTGGALITSYTVTASPGGITATGTSSPIRVYGLTEATAYTFSVVATNSNSDSSASSASSASITTVSSTNTFAYCDGTRITDIVELTSTTGRTWMDRNLGANRVAQSNNDNYAYGCLYQWGRGNDGHASINWTSATTGVAVAVASNSLSSSSSPGNSTYYYPTAPVVDWLSSPNNDLWQGLQGVNNPCPDGFRLPTRAEYVAEFTAYSISSSANNNAIFTNGPGTGFKFTLSSFRYNGALNNININPNDKAGFYWTSTIGPSTSKSYHTYFTPTSVSNLENSRYFGLSVRCVR